MMKGARFLSSISIAKQILRLQSRLQQAIPKGHVAVYVGDTEKKRYMVPITYLSHPSFQQLLRYAEEEFGFRHPMGGLTIPCDEQVFFQVTSMLQSSCSS